MNTFIIIITVLLFCLGTLGTLLPALPGLGLVYAGILVYAFADGFTTIQTSTVVYLGLATLVFSIAQYAGSIWAAKSAGGRKKTLIGTLLGGLLGTMAGLVGIFLGAFVGALAGALLEGSTPEKAIHIASRSIIGIVGGSIIQFFLALALIGSFILALFV